MEQEGVAEEFKRKVKKGEADLPPSTFLQPIRLVSTMHRPATLTANERGLSLEAVVESLWIILIGRSCMVYLSFLLQALSRPGRSFRTTRPAIVTAAQLKIDRFPANSAPRGGPTAA